MNGEGLQASMLYLVAYYLMNLGAFGVLIYFHGQTGKETYESLNGLGRAAPLISISAVVFVVSLTGLPPTVGFYGKLAVASAAMGVQDGAYAWLVLLMLLNSVVSLYYYMRVAKHLFLRDSDGQTVRPQPAMAALLVVFAALNVIFLLYVEPLEKWTAASMDLLLIGR
jgi:NADH-quinone oxidoreductase subunit N